MKAQVSLDLIFAMLIIVLSLGLLRVYFGDTNPLVGPARELCLEVAQAAAILQDLRELNLSGGWDIRADEINIYTDRVSVSVMGVQCSWRRAT